MTDENMIPASSEFKKVLHDIKKIVANTNINFLIGSGLSHPFLEVLKGIEESLTSAETEAETIAIQKEYFNKSMLGNLLLLSDEVDAAKEKVLNDYREFYRSINYLLLKREDSILTKQVNIFTTNVDIFSEKALEETGIEFNDGFSGRFNPHYDAGNFKKSYFKKSLHYENTSEIPIFNILKLHGSLSWEQKSDSIVLDKDLSLVQSVKTDISNDKNFQNAYDKLLIVNPTKKKFEDTVLDRRYYDLLRIYSNELEKESSTLIVMGFSFADEHIQSLTLQVANSNPTLTIYIFSHSHSQNELFEEINSKAKNKNIKVIYPEDGSKYNLETITKEIFEKIYTRDAEIQSTENLTPSQDEE
jgi:NAD-dependent SIR2 family protein deacetylase